MTGTSRKVLLTTAPPLAETTAIPPAELTDDMLTREMELALERMRGVETQLGQPRRHHPDGTEYTLDEFHEWRRSAKFAKAAILNRYTQLKAEWKRRQAAVHANEPEHRDRALQRIEARLERTNELLERVVALLEET